MKKLKEETNSKEKTRLFTNFKTLTKTENINSRINSDKLNIKNNNRILSTVSYGNDPNFQESMLHLDNLRKKEKEECLEYIRQKNKKDPLLSKLDINKKISFSDFYERFKVNNFIINYFDYYEIQKINKKKTAELIQKIKQKLRGKKQSLKIKYESNEQNHSNHSYHSYNNSENNDEIKSNSESFKNFKRRISLINSNNYRNSLNLKKINIKNFINDINNNKNSIYIDGIDFNLIKALYSDIEENDKKINDLLLINEIRKEKNLYMHKNIDRKNYYKNNYTPDKYSIAHSLDKKSKTKLKRLKLLIDKKLEKDRPKTTKTLSTYDFQYLNYIPNTSQYKHITYHKNLIFNNEFINTKKGKKNKFNKKNKYNNIKTESNIYSERNLLIKSNKLINNLSQIKSVLKKDKNYTSKTILRANTTFKRNYRIKSDQRLMESLMKDNKKTIGKIKQIKEKYLKKEKINIFRELKEMTKSTDKNSIESTEVFTKTLNTLCKEEKKFNKNYKNFIKNNYYLKLEELQENNIENTKAKDNIHNYILSYENLKLNIKKRCKEINNIIKKSKKSKI